MAQQIRQLTDDEYKLIKTIDERNAMDEAVTTKTLAGVLGKRPVHQPVENLGEMLLLSNPISNTTGRPIGDQLVLTQLGRDTLAREEARRRKQAVAAGTAKDDDDEDKPKAPKKAPSAQKAAKATTGALPTGKVSLRPPETNDKHKGQIEE